jgi:ATP-dependent helicase/nuclease subunit B
VGPRGLLRRLGRLLGLPAEPGSTPDRIAAFDARLALADDGHRSYSRSRKADRFGVAAFLLGLRDRLRDSGWRGTSLQVNGRLADVAALETLAAPGLPALAPGMPDLVHFFADAVARAGRLPEPVALHLASPRSAFGAAERRLIDTLARAGVEVTEAAADAAQAPTGTDLDRVQRSLLGSAPAGSPLTGDGTFLVLQAETPAEAAELLASFLRDRSLAATTLVVPQEASVLDASLLRQGLATLGLGTSSRWRPALQVLPLRLALAFRPRDPLRAAELLLLPVSPMAARIRRRLLDALTEMPGLWGPAWNRAVDELADLASAEDGPEAGARVRADIEAWYGGDSFDPAEGIPTAAASGICQTVGAWAAARGGASDPPDESLLHAAAVARTLERLLAHQHAVERLSRVALEQLHDGAVGDGSEHAPLEGEAGRAAVCGSPDAVLPGASEVVWWGFVGGEGGPSPDPWTEAERVALVSSGVELAAPGAVREVEAWGWRRPILLASERVVLVRWRLSGSDQVPDHPLLDELATRLPRGSLEACTLESRQALSAKLDPPAPSTWSPRASVRAPAPPIVPRSVWRLPAAETVLPPSMSPSSLESLFGCPLTWVLRGRGLLAPGRVASIPEGNRLLGSFAHAILQDLLLGPQALDLAVATPDDAAQRTGQAFDARVESEAAPLVLAGRDLERARARRLVCESAAALVALLRDGRWVPEEAEAEVSGDLGVVKVHGRVDLLLSRNGEPAVIDLKLGNGKYRRGLLEKGRGVQLAVYSAALRRGGEYPPTGYFILESGQLLTTTPARFPGSTGVPGATTHETIEWVKKGVLLWRKVLGAGVVPAPRESLEGWREPVEEAAGEPFPDDGPLAPEPSCMFCDYSTLCVVRLGAGDAP